MNEKNWYAMRFLYGCRKNTPERLEEAGIRSYTPMQCRTEIKRGKRINSFTPVIPSLLFVYSSPQELEPILNANNFFQYQYRRGGKRGEALIVPDNQMEDFIKASTQTDNPIYFESNALSLTVGTPVRVIAGPLKGLIGTFMKVRGARSRRIVISLPGILSLAAEVDKEWVEEVENLG